MDNYIRKTKIICTLGPASGSADMLERLALAGMNVARFNFSHSDYAAFEDWFANVRAVREKLGLPIATMLDTKGPEIRTGEFENAAGVTVKKGDSFTFTTKAVVGNESMCSVSYKGLTNDVRPGMDILINDGLVAMRVDSVNDCEIKCTVIDGGVISRHKGVNVPGVSLAMPYLSEDDMNDLKFGAKLGFDFIAASFCRTAADIAYLRDFCHALGWNDVRIIAKIENYEGIEHLDGIIKEADGIMVARGDMGVEIEFEKIPSIQKMIINKVYAAGKIVVTATQMLESMITNPRPTRAEITDVANAVYDGTSAIMLSGETAMGSHPVEAVQAMDLIAKTTENDIDYKERFSKSVPKHSHGDITSAISHATVTTAHDLNAAAIITVTKSGTTARQVSKYRPECPIISATTSKKVCRQNNLSWGVIPVMCSEKTNTDELFRHAAQVAMQTGVLKKDDVVVITAGIPLGQSGTTNMLKVAVIENDA
ncbi:MAG: pyruvate kinase [Clostridiales bacterium]|nr:pyruvate kinase [Clostridiales bacterium]